MKGYKYYKITVQFNLKNEKVTACIMNNFDYDKMDDNGIIQMTYRGNGKSTLQSAINGMKKILSSYEAFKRNYKILKAEEKEQ